MYKIQPSTERFIIITPPGRYKLLINAEGFHPLEVPIIVYGKGSYKSEISRQFKLSPVGEYPPIHYSKIEHN